MLTTGSKFLIGSSVLATISAILYGITQDGVMGTIGLASAAIALAFLAGINIATRDANVWADEISDVETAPAAARTPSDSVWPMAFAVGAVILTLGLVTYEAVFIIGAVVLLASGAEWTAQAWADRASAEARYNAEVRGRIANPLEFPLGGAIGIAIVVYSFSRIMLWLSKTNTVVAFATLGAIIIVLAFFFAYRPGLKSRAAVGVIAIGVIGLVAGGAAAGVDGQRTIHPHETTAGLSAEGVDICASPERFEADDNASQRVASSAGAAARIVLDKNGTLQLDENGPNNQGTDALTLARSNPSNIIFINESGTDRRLTVDLGMRTEKDAQGAETQVPNQLCTTLVDQNGKQNLTVKADIPSLAVTEGYSFFVPGVESARLPLVVP